MTTPHEIIVVGGGLAGLMAVIHACERGANVRLFSLVPCKRSHSVCAQGGINGAVNTMDEGDHPDIHTYDTLKSGEFINDQVLAQEMAYAAPGIIYTLDRMGVPFSRTPEGNLAFRRFGGTLHHRTAHAGASTGQQLLYALDEQVRAWEAQGKVTRHEFWDMLEIVKDDSGVCRGIIAQDLRSMQMQAFAGDAVILATGGYGLIYGKSTCSQIVTGSATAIAMRNGVHFANPEFVQVHPTAIPGEDKLRLMSESARGEGGRVWVPKKKGDTRNPKQIPEDERNYFLEEKYPRYGNLVPRDVATREIFQQFLDGFGIGGGPQVYLDLTHKPADFLRKKLGAILEIYEKFVGEDPTQVPMRIFPGVHYTMGGIWCSYDSTPDRRLDWESPNNLMTNMPGLYAAGESEFQYHGANRLGANSLVSCIFSGKVSARAAVVWQKGLADRKDPKPFLDAALKRCQKEEQAIRNNQGDVNPYQLHVELGEMMTKYCSVVRDNKGLDAAIGALEEMTAKAKRIKLEDTGAYANHGVTFTRWLHGMLDLSWAVALAARKRDEFRGAHYKPAFELKQPDGMVPKDYWVWLDANRPAQYSAHYENWFGKTDKAKLRNWLLGADWETLKAKTLKKGFSPAHEEYFRSFTAATAQWNKPSLVNKTADGFNVHYGEVKMELMPPMPRKYD